jgi:hypothetical protein
MSICRPLVHTPILRASSRNSSINKLQNGDGKTQQKHNIFFQIPREEKITHKVELSDNSSKIIYAEYLYISIEKDSVK